MTIDTTRLRADAEAVRDAGVTLHTASNRVAKLREDVGPSQLLTDAHREHRGAAEALRGAQKRLYADAPPDGIILALLDEVDALRARVAALDPAPVLESERAVVLWHHRDDDEELPSHEMDEAVYSAISSAGWGRCGILTRPEMVGDEVTVYGFARMQPTLAAWRYLESAIEDLDEEHGSPNGPFQATPAMVAASEAFARTMEREYVSWACEVVETRAVNVREWCAVHRPGWLAQLPPVEPQEGVGFKRVEATHG